MNRLQISIFQSINKRESRIIKHMSRLIIKIVNSYLILKDQKIGIKLEVKRILFKNLQKIVEIETITVKLVDITP